jgi:hypothetical protein
MIHERARRRAVPEDYSGVMPAACITGPQDGACSAMSGVATAALSASLSLATAAAGVPGAISPPRPRQARRR